MFGTIKGKMKKCHLCQKAEANQTGSHLTSCFMVNSMLGERDNEKGYVISSEGGDYTKNQKADSIKEDNVFCIGCESRLSYLEGYFSSEYTNKIDESRYAANFPNREVNGFSICEPTNINPFAFHLLINSVLWRAHISNKPLFVNYRIPKEAAEQIRLTLDTVLPPYENFKVKGKYSKWISELESVKELIEFYPYVILRTELEEQDRTENLIYFSDVEDNPYHHIINEFVILSFFKGEEIEFDKQDFFELSKKYDLKEVVNEDIDDLKIGNLKLNDWRAIRDKIYGIIVNKYKMRWIVRDCIRIAFSRGFYPTIEYMEHCIECRKNL